MHALPRASPMPQSDLPSDIKIIADGKSASARSAVALMALDVHKGDRVSVVASGVDRDAAARAVCAVLSTVEQEQSSLAKAAHVAMLAYNEIAGVCAVPGVALGTAFRWRRKSADIPEDGQGAEHERKALEGAIAQVSSELRAVRNGTTGAAGEIADAHLGLLDDESLTSGSSRQIEAGRSAAYAWTAATSECGRGPAQDGQSAHAGAGR